MNATWSVNHKKTINSDGQYHWRSKDDTSCPSIIFNTLITQSCLNTYQTSAADRRHQTTEGLGYIHLQNHNQFIIVILIHDHTNALMNTLIRQLYR